MKILFHTPLSVGECVKTITENATKRTFSSEFFSYYSEDMNFLYSLDGSKFQLEKVINYRNSFKPIFYGTFIEQKKETVIEGEFHMHLFVRIFMAIWLSMAFIMSITMIIGSFFPKESSGIDGMNAALGVLFSIFFIGFGIGIVKVGRHFGIKQEQETIEFIERILKAKKQ